VIEIVFVLVLIAGLIGGAALVVRAPWDWLFGGGGAMVVLGMAFGVPLGFWYHVRLYRALRPRGPLPKTWWINPSRLHARLSDEERRAVMRPFYAGAVGWVLAVVGCALCAYGAFRAPPG
jgi:hypothetical protein